MLNRTPRIHYPSIGNINIAKCEDHRPIAKNNVARFLYIAQSQTFISQKLDELSQPIAKIIVAKNIAAIDFVIMVKYISLL